MDQPAGPPASVTVMRDERGVPCMALVRHGDAISFSVLNVGSRHSHGTVNLKGTEQDNPGGHIATDRVAVTLDGLKSTATIDLLTNAKPATRIELQAGELDAVLAALGEARAIMREGVPIKTPEQRSARELVILDPAWRAEPQLHPSLAGIFLRLRHPGFGWLSVPPSTPRGAITGELAYKECSAR